MIMNYANSQGLGGDFKSNRINIGHLYYIRYAATISEDINDHISTRKVRI